MTEKKVSRLGLSLSVIPLLILLLTACGTSKSNSGDNNLSPAQAQEIAHAMSESVSQSVGGGFGAFSAAANHKDSAPRSGQGKGVPFESHDDDAMINDAGKHGVKTRRQSRHRPTKRATP